MFITKKKIVSFFAVLMIVFAQFSFSLFVNLAQADETLINKQNFLTNVGRDSYGSETPKDVKIIVLDLIKTALALVSLIFVALILIAGFKWMTAGGNETIIKETKASMINLSIGLFIVLGSWGITNWIINVLVCQTVQSTGCGASLILKF